MQIFLLPLSGLDLFPNYGRETWNPSFLAARTDAAVLSLVQVILIRVHSSFSTTGQFLYSLYSISSEPGAEADLARMTSLSLGGGASNRADGCEGLGTYPGEPSGWFLTGSLY